LEYNIEDGLIVNAIAWDGETPYDPGDGMALVSLGESGAWIGWTYNAETKDFMPPPEHPAE